MKQIDHNKLVFAPLIRVSTEEQEKRGESLKTQKADLVNDIESMGGKIFKFMKDKNTQHQIMNGRFLKHLYWTLNKENLLPLLFGILIDGRGII